MLSFFSRLLARGACFPRLLFFTRLLGLLRRPLGAHRLHRGPPSRPVLGFASLCSPVQLGPPREACVPCLQSVAPRTYMRRLERVAGRSEGMNPGGHIPLSSRRRAGARAPVWNSVLRWHRNAPPVAPTAPSGSRPRPARVAGTIESLSGRPASLASRPPARRGASSAELGHAGLAAGVPRRQELLRVLDGPSATRRSALRRRGRRVVGRRRRSEGPRPASVRSPHCVRSRRGSLGLGFFHPRPGTRADLRGNQMSSDAPRSARLACRFHAIDGVPIGVRRCGRGCSTMPHFEPSSEGLVLGFFLTTAGGSCADGGCSTMPHFEPSSEGFLVSPPAGLVRTGWPRPRGLVRTGVAHAGPQDPRAGVRRRCLTSDIVGRGVRASVSHITPSDSSSKRDRDARGDRRRGRRLTDWHVRRSGRWRRGWGVGPGDRLTGRRRDRGLRRGARRLRHGGRRRRGARRRNGVRSAVVTSPPKTTASQQGIYFFFGRHQRRQVRSGVNGGWST